MPTFFDSTADTAEASEALRGLAHASRGFDQPAEMYGVIGDLSSGVHSLRQALDQIADVHERKAATLSTTPAITKQECETRSLLRKSCVGPRTSSTGPTTGSRKVSSLRAGSPGTRARRRGGRAGERVRLRRTRPEHQRSRGALGRLRTGRQPARRLRLAAAPLHRTRGTAPGGRTGRTGSGTGRAGTAGVVLVAGRSEAGRHSGGEAGSFVVRAGQDHGSQADAGLVRDLLLDATTSRHDPRSLDRRDVNADAKPCEVTIKRDHGGAVLKRQCGEMGIVRQVPRRSCLRK